MAWNSSTDTVSTAVISANAPSATGLQTYTIPGGAGITPVAAMIFMSGATVDKVSAAHARMAIGTTDGTRQRLQSIISEDGLPATGTISFIDNATPILVSTVETHSLKTGDIVLMTGTANATINGNKYAVTVAGANTYTLDFTTGGSSGGGGSWNCDHNNYQGASNAQLVGLLDPSGKIGNATEAWESYGAFDSFGSDFIKINWQKVSAGGEYLHIVLFGGTHVNAYVNDAVGNNQSLGDNTPTTVTGVGFMPDLVFPFGMPGAFTVDATNATSMTHAATLAFGAVARGGGSGGMMPHAANGTGLDASNQSACAGRIQDTNATYYHQTTGSINITTRAVHTINNFTADGFDLFTENIGDGVALPTAFLALGFSDSTAAVKVQSANFGTGTGSKSDSTIGFKPQMLFFIQSNIRNLNVNQSLADDRAFHMQIGVAAGPSDEYVVGISSQDGVSGQTPCKAKSIRANQMTYMRDTADTKVIQGNTFSTMDASGYSYVVSFGKYATPSPSKDYIVIAIQEAQAAPSGNDFTDGIGRGIGEGICRGIG